jgi:hypothetical protein
MRHVRACYPQCQVNSASSGLSGLETGIKLTDVAPHHVGVVLGRDLQQQLPGGRGRLEVWVLPIESLAVESAPQFLDLEFDDAANVGCVLARPGPVSGLHIETAAPCNTTQRLSWRC